MNDFARSAKAADRKRIGREPPPETTNENTTIDLGLSVTIYYRNTSGELIEMGVSEAAPSETDEAAFGLAAPIKQSFSLQLDAEPSYEAKESWPDEQGIPIQPKAH